MQTDYEYIVVGSGAGGGTLAANLASAGHKVLLLEAGGSPESYDYQVPAFHPRASENKDMSWEFFVRHYADDTQQRRDSKFVEARNGIFYPRAGTLGGCTAHHAMIIVYPDNSDWDYIAEVTGDESWRGENMRRYFQRLERCNYRRVQKLLQSIFHFNPSRHGFDGWLSTNKADPRLVIGDEQLLEIIVDSALSTLKGDAEDTLIEKLKRLLMRLRRGVKTRLDPNDWRLVKERAQGIRFTPLSVEQGRRVSARERIISVQKAYPENLVIKTGVLVTRVLFDKNDARPNADQRAIGVEYLEGEHLYGADPRRGSGNGGQRREIRASREVILAGGAFNTPQLLQLSGIGPARLLEQHGIEVLVDRPGVGANLQDRYEVTVVNRMKQPFAMLKGAVFRPPRNGEEPDRHFREWQQRGEGIYTTNGAVLSIIKKSQPTKLDSDLFLFGLVCNFRGYYPGYSEDLFGHNHLTWAILKGHTGNRKGTVAIRSPDPRDTPDINFRYFQEGSDPDGEDLEAVVDAVELVRNMTAKYRELIAEEELPGEHIKTRDQLSRFVKDEAWGHHASCTCKVGAPDDAMAVLDSRFRVYGTRNLRVVDASVFPRIPGLFIVSAVYMIAEKASEVILADSKG